MTANPTFLKQIRAEDAAAHAIAKARAAARPGISAQSTSWNDPDFGEPLEAGMPAHDANAAEQAWLGRNDAAFTDQF